MSVMSCCPMPSKMYVGRLLTSLEDLPSDMLDPAQLGGHMGLASARENEGSLRGVDALVYCGQPDGQRQLLRLGQLSDKVDGVAQVWTWSAPQNTRCCHTVIKVPAAVSGCNR